MVERAAVIDYVLPASISYSLPAWVPFPGRRRFRQSLRRLDQIIFEIIRREQDNAT